MCKDVYPKRCHALTLQLMDAGSLRVAESVHVCLGCGVRELERRLLYK